MFVQQSKCKFASASLHTNGFACRAYAPRDLLYFHLFLYSFGLKIFRSVPLVWSISLSLTLDCNLEFSEASSLLHFDESFLDLQVSFGGMDFRVPSVGTGNSSAEIESRGISSSLKSDHLSNHLLFLIPWLLFVKLSALRI